jgi:hypothetical protein
MAGVILCGDGVRLLWELSNLSQGSGWFVAVKKYGLAEWCIWRNFGDLVRCFGGEVVVGCVANVVEKQSL